MALVIMYQPGLLKMDLAALRMAHEASKEIAADMRRYTPVRTGLLRSTIRVRRLIRSSRVYIGTDYWHFIEYGVEPHIIRAKFKKVLIDSETGRVLGKKVHHPGHRAYRPVRRAFYQKRPGVAHKITIPGG